MAQRKLKNVICFFVMLHEMGNDQGVSPKTEKQRTVFWNNFEAESLS